MGKAPYVQRVASGGRVRLYFRRGEVRRPLKSADGSPELAAEVAEILAELAQIERARTPIPGTVGGALHAYNRSSDFLSLARSTQANYQRLIDELIADAGEIRLTDVSRAVVKAMMDAWAPRGYRVANLRFQILKNALESAVLDGRIPSDPFIKIKKVPRPHDAPEPNPIWSDAEVQVAIDSAIEGRAPGLARAIGLGRWGGFRRQTICAVPVSARLVTLGDDGVEQRRLHWLTAKRRVVCDKVEDARLTQLLAATPDRADTVAYNQRGGRWEERQLNQALDRLLERLAVDGRVRPVLTLHGLRHSRGVELAMAGASDAEIMCQLEHASSRTAQIYRRQAERRQMADAAQIKVDAARALKARTFKPMLGSVIS